MNITEALGIETPILRVGDIAPKLEKYTVYTDVGNPSRGIIVSKGDNVVVGLAELLPSFPLMDFDTVGVDYFEMAIRADYTPNTLAPATLVSQCTSLKRIPEAYAIKYSTDSLLHGAALYNEFLAQGLTALVKAELCLKSNPFDGSDYIRKAVQSLLEHSCLEIKEYEDVAESPVTGATWLVDRMDKRLIGFHTVLPDCETRSELESVRVVSNNPVVLSSIFHLNE